MKASTRTLVETALRADESVSPELVDAILAALDGKTKDLVERPLLLTMTAAARLSGMGRTWFWEQVCADATRDPKWFPPNEVSPGVFRYRRKDIEAFADRVTVYRPKQRMEQKIHELRC